MNPPGAVRTSLDPRVGLTEFLVSGTVTVELLLDAVHAFYAGQPTRLVLWDCRGADFSALKAEHVRLLLGAIPSAATSRPGGKTAGVFSGDAGYGLGRMFEMLQELQGSDVERRSFRDMDEARRWLGLE
jgi:hypothetical protein